MLTVTRKGQTTVHNSVESETWSKTGVFDKSVRVGDQADQWNDRTQPEKRICASWIFVTYLCSTYFTAHVTVEVNNINMTRAG